jgi:hypothetical protein
MGTVEIVKWADLQTLYSGVYCLCGHLFGQGLGLGCHSFGSRFQNLLLQCISSFMWRPLSCLLYRLDSLFPHLVRQWAGSFAHCLSRRLDDTLVHYVGYLACSLLSNIFPPL